MASDPRTASVTVEFDPNAYTKDGNVVMELSGWDSGDTDLVYFRVHGRKGHNIRTTSGSVNKTGGSYDKFSSEFIFFSGDVYSQLRYPNPKYLSIQPIGSFYDDAGNRLSRPSLRLDKAKNAITSEKSHVMHGVALVEYKAPYELWRASFTGVCPSVEPFTPPVDVSIGSVDDDVSYQGRDPMVAMAWLGGVMDASLNIEPPDCDYDEGNSTLGRRIMKVVQSTIVIEVDENDKVNLRDGVTSNILFE